MKLEYLILFVLRVTNMNNKDKREYTVIILMNNYSRKQKSQQLAHFVEKRVYKILL